MKPGLTRPELEARIVRVRKLIWKARALVGAFAGFTAVAWMTTRIVDWISLVAGILSCLMAASFEAEVDRLVDVLDGMTA